MEPTKVVVRYSNGTIARGFVQNFSPNRDFFYLSPADKPTGQPLQVSLRRLKAVFVVRDFRGNPQFQERNFYMEGENPNQGEKAKSKIYLVQKGNRIVSFLCTQWRPLKGTYDPALFNEFEEFVKSFKYLKPSFYESFEDQLKQAGL